MPLSDIRVVDMTQVVAGPVATAFLADLGADVVKVERPAGDVYRVARREFDGEPFNPPFELYNRNKRGVALDLKTDEGRDVFEDLLADADVFVQNWPPGVAERLDLDYETLGEQYEDLIYVHITGYGETGPDARKPAMDTIIQHVTGFSHLLGYEDHPPIRSQSSLSDFYAGYNAALSTMAAIRARDRGEGGQKVDVSLMESMMHNMDGAFEYYTNLGEEPGHGGKNAFFNPDMLYGAARAADDWIVVGLLLYSDRVWEAYCDLLDRPDLLEREKYQTDDGRMDDAEELTAMFEEWLRERPAEEAIETLNDAGIPASRHHTISEAAEMDQVEARGVFREVSHPRYGSISLTNSPLDLAGHDTDVDRPAPLLGQHNRAVLADLGYSEEEIDALESAGVLVDED
ncbi:MAG: CaiB/BaiF CoA transferase family protein [Halanaeroarchaeum sp.]